MCAVRHINSLRRNARPLALKASIHRFRSEHERSSTSKRDISPVVTLWECSHWLCVAAAPVVVRYSLLRDIFDEKSDTSGKRADTLSPTQKAAFLIYVSFLPSLFLLLHCVSKRAVPHLVVIYQPRRIPHPPQPLTKLSQTWHRTLIPCLRYPQNFLFG